MIIGITFDSDVIQTVDHRALFKLRSRVENSEDRSPRALAPWIIPWTNPERCEIFSISLLQFLCDQNSRRHLRLLRSNPSTGTRHHVDAVDE